MARDCLTESTNDDDHLRLEGKTLLRDRRTRPYQFHTVHPFPANAIGKITKKELTEESANRMGNFDTQVLITGVGTTIVVNVANHSGGDGNGKYIISICEKSDA